LIHITHFPVHHNTFNHLDMQVLHTWLHVRFSFVVSVVSLILGSFTSSLVDADHSIHVDSTLALCLWFILIFFTSFTDGFIFINFLLTVFVVTTVSLVSISVVIFFGFIALTFVSSCLCAIVEITHKAIHAMKTFILYNWYIC